MNLEIFKGVENKIISVNAIRRLRIGRFSGAQGQDAHNRLRSREGTDARTVVRDGRTDGWMDAGARSDCCSGSRLSAALCPAGLAI